jgi:ribosomal protein S12 methylthiotransferase
VSAPHAVVSLVHLGCARNLIDSELILGRLAEQGLVVSGDEAAADTVVLNTCSFIGPAREESEGQIRRLLEKKRRGQLQRVVVAGCLVQRYKHELARRFPGVDLFAEISDGRALAKAIRRMAQGQRVESYLSGPGLREPERDAARLLSTPRSFGYLRISHGCDHTCSFCAIPSIRGPHRSKRPTDLLDEARELVDAGVRELVLVAEDSTAWGRDLGSELPALVEALAELEGEHRLRVMYAYPNRFPWELVPLLREHPRVVPYLDIPVQHVATPVLRAMRRAGSGDEVRAILDRLRAEAPEVTLRTTLLVGFPGETAQHAAELVDFVRAYRLARLGTFTYSPEEGTTGFDMPGTVPHEEAARRQQAVLAARDEVLAGEQRSWIGRELEVLVDEAHPDGRAEGLSGEAGACAVGRGAMDAPEVDLVTIVAGSRAAVGERVRVVVQGLDAELNLLARPVTAHVEAPA